jgi:hypothetical protein
VTGATYWDEVLVSFQDPTIGTGPYVAAYGFQTYNSPPLDVVEIDTTTQMTGSACALGSNNASSGLTVHVPDTGIYSDDYELQLYDINSLSWDVSIYASIVNGCWGAPADCGPEFWPPGGKCENNMGALQLCP